MPYQAGQMGWLLPLRVLICSALGSVVVYMFCFSQSEDSYAIHEEALWTIVHEDRKRHYGLWSEPGIWVRANVTGNN